MSREKSNDASLFKIAVGKRLKEFAVKMFESGSGLARALDMHPSSLHSAYFQGRNFPGGEILIKLHFLGCDIAWLLTGEGLPPDPTDEQADKWLENCRAKVESIRTLHELERLAAEEYIRNMKRFLEQQGKGEGEEENETP